MICYIYIYMYIYRSNTESVVLWLPTYAMPCNKSIYMYIYIYIFIYVDICENIYESDEKEMREPLKRV